MDTKIELSSGGQRTKRFTGVRKFTVSIPEVVVQMLDNSSKIEKMSRSAFMTQVILEGYRRYLNGKLHLDRSFDADQG